MIHSPSGTRRRPLIAQQLPFLPRPRVTRQFYHYTVRVTLYRPEMQQGPQAIRVQVHLYPTRPILYLLLLGPPH